MQPALQFQSIAQTFSTQNTPVQVLESVDLTIQEGEFVCLLGPSGCGKSTLLNAAAGFVQPTQGQVCFRGHPISGPSPERGMVFQEYALFPWMNVEDNIAFGLESRGESKEFIQARVADLLAKLRLSEFAKRWPRDLSGGMRQRVAIARVLALDPPCLLMDEPFGALDALTRRSLQDELLQLWSELGKTVVFVTHSIEEAILLADRIVVMTHRPGKIKQDCKVEIARPRNPSDPAFNALKHEIGQLVMAEQHAFENAERLSFTAD
jgi:NitT/TauT family transport system ATP-binding protein